MQLCKLFDMTKIIRTHRFIDPVTVVLGYCNGLTTTKIVRRKASFHEQIKSSYNLQTDLVIIPLLFCGTFSHLIYATMLITSHLHLNIKLTSL